MDWSPAQGVLPTVYRIKKLKSGQGTTKDWKATDRQTVIYLNNWRVCFRAEMTYYGNTTSRNHWNSIYVVGGAAVDIYTHPSQS
jgi:hypothetical protein